MRARARRAWTSRPSGARRRLHVSRVCAEWRWWARLKDVQEEDLAHSDGVAAGVDLAVRVTVQVRRTHALLRW
jgi:hypothetical protein